MRDHGLSVYPKPYSSSCSSCPNLVHLVLPFPVPSCLGALVPWCLCVRLHIVEKRGRMKGIVLAGGTATRLFPATLVYASNPSDLMGAWTVSGGRV